MAIYRVRENTKAYGYELGVLLIDCQQPLIPGDVGNASTWPFPVLYTVVPGCTVERLVFTGDPTLEESIRERVEFLESQGVRGITSNCGFMIRYQSQITESANVPVFLSSLLQLPAMLATIGRHQCVGIVTACESRLSSDLLRLAHVSPQDPVVVYGIDAYPEFEEPFIRDSGMVDTEALESVCSDLGKRMIAEHPEMGSILLECADLPPYAHAFQRATGLPVFDFATMITYLVSGNRRVPYAGLY